MIHLIRWKQDCVIEVCENPETLESIEEERPQGGIENAEIIEGTNHFF